MNDNVAIGPKAAADILREARGHIELASRLVGKAVSTLKGRQDTALRMSLKSGWLQGTAFDIGGIIETLEEENGLMAD